jgi:hypothetical protein
LQRQIFSLPTPRPQSEDACHRCCQLFSCAPKSSEKKILQEQPFDCRRDYILWCSTLKKKSLESTVKRKSSEKVSDVELQAASSLAQMGRKKAKKAVKKIVSSEVRRVPSAFVDDLFVESSQKGFSFGLC